MSDKATICIQLGERRVRQLRDRLAATHGTALRGLQGLLVDDSGYGVARYAPLVTLARPVGVTNLEFPWKLRQLFKARWRIETVVSKLKEDWGCALRAAVAACHL